MSPDQRRVARRSLLLEAGLEVFGTRGYASSSVLEVCREAELTERYFYESFHDRQELLGAVVRSAVEDFLAAAAPLIPLIEIDVGRAIDEGAEAFVATVADDPRRARVLFVEAVGVSPAMEQMRRSMIARIVEFLRLGATSGYGPWVRDSVEFEIVGAGPGRRHPRAARRLRPRRAGNRSP